MKKNVIPTPVNLDTITLARGGHSNKAQGTCLMEAISVITKDKFSAAPVCVARPLRDFGIMLNDHLSDVHRNEFLKPLIPCLLGTNKTKGLIWKKYYQNAKHNEKIRTFLYDRLAEEFGARTASRWDFFEHHYPHTLKAIDILREAAIYAKSLIGPPYADKPECCSDDFKNLVQKKTSVEPVRKTEKV